MCLSSSVVNDSQKLWQPVDDKIKNDHFSKVNKGYGFKKQELENHWSYGTTSVLTLSSKINTHISSYFRLSFRNSLQFKPLKWINLTVPKS